MNRDTVAILAGGSGGYRLSDIGFLSEEERQEIMKMQDEVRFKSVIFSSFILISVDCY